MIVPLLSPVSNILHGLVLLGGGPQGLSSAGIASSLMLLAKTMWVMWDCFLAIAVLCRCEARSAVAISVGFRRSASFSLSPPGLLCWLLRHFVPCSFSSQWHSSHYYQLYAPCLSTLLNGTISGFANTENSGKNKWACEVVPLAVVMNVLQNCLVLRDLRRN